MSLQLIKNFIVFEGIDGAGTTTQAQLLTQYFNENKKTVFLTSEPSPAPSGKFLRRCLSGEFKLQASTLLMLFAADRNEHIFGKGGILEALENFDYVISDRYLFSSLAYQGASGYFDLAKKCNEDFPLPETLFFFTIDIDRAFERVEKRACEKEIYENKLFQEKVSNMYKRVLNLYTESGMNIIMIDANKSIEEVHLQIREKIRL